MKEKSNTNKHRTMPDDRVSKKEMFEYGYKWGVILPVLPDAAINYAEKMEVYALYPDDSEALATPETLRSQHELYGIELSVWVGALAKEIEELITNGYLNSDWNGFPAGTKSSDVVSWLESAFDLPFIETYYSTMNSIRIDKQNFHMKMEKGFLKIRISSDEMIRRLEYILGRRIEEQEKWIFYFVYAPTYKPSISAFNTGNSGSDDITEIADIIKHDLFEAYEFIRRYKLDKVYHRNYEALKKGTIVV